MCLFVGFCGEVTRLFCVSEATVRLARGDFARLRRTTINTGSRNRALILREDVEALLLEKSEDARATNPTPFLLINKKRACKGKEMQLRGGRYGRPVNFIQHFRFSL